MNEIKSCYLQVKNVQLFPPCEFAKRFGLPMYFHCGTLWKWPVVFVFHYDLE